MYVLFIVKHSYNNKIKNKMKNSSKVVNEFTFLEILRLYMIFEVRKLCSMLRMFSWYVSWNNNRRKTEETFVQVPRNLRVLIKSYSHVYICQYWPLCLYNMWEISASGALINILSSDSFIVSRSKWLWKMTYS